MTRATGFFAAALCAALLTAAHHGRGAEALPETAVKLSTVTVLTEDFPPMLKFYRDVVGLELLRVSGDYAEFGNEGLRLHLTTRSMMKQAVPHDSWDEERGGQCFELAFSVASPEAVDAFYRRVIDLGATPIQPPANVPWGQRVAFFADPDGNIHDIFALLPPAGE